ncbi:hypothetical protein ONE63_002129 [Megalurothrips usitatus]|uniref:SSD domain-containing protein n=1 Tax=Megalurothrips usitatus TaxID=439358 RepID=A0AAV7XAI7_9NEOP|nr:hypothetical protein ONE63_002129 [Megalurothrips usitatus]
MTVATTVCLGLVLALLALPAMAAADGAQCIWYGECNTDDKGFKQNCAVTSPAQKLTNETGLQLLKQDCPWLYNETGDSYTCCDTDQLITMHANMLKAAGIYSRCPSCFRNFFSIFCHVTCSTAQSDFVEVVDTKSNGNGQYVTEMNVYLTQDSMDKVFGSCRGVVMPQSGKYATDIACGAYDALSCNTERWFQYMGKDNPFDPFVINFLNTSGIFGDMIRQDIPTVPCNESADASSLACSCVDCAASCPADSSDMFKPKKDIFIKVLGVDVFVFAAVAAYLLILVVTIVVIVARSRRRRQRGERASAPVAVLTTIGAWGKASRLQQWGFASEQFLEAVFRRIGVACARNPVMVFFVASWVLAPLIYGFPYIELISNPVQLWASPVSQSRQEKDYFDSRFGPFYRAEQIFIKAVGLPEIQHNMTQGTINFGPVFNKDFLLKVRELQMAIQDLGRAEGYPLEQICFAPLHNEFTGPITVEKCTITSVWGYFQNSLEKFNSEGEKNGYKTNYLDQIYDCLQNSYDPKCLAPYGGPAENLLVVGGFLDDPDKTMIQATALVINLVVTNHLDEKDNQLAMVWEKKLIEYLQRWQSEEMPDYMDLAFMTERSIEDEIQRVSETSAGTIVLSYGIMLVYVAVALGRVSNWRRLLIDSKIVVAVGGVFSVALSMLAAVGFFAYIKFPTILLTIEAVPFLVLAVGVDNLFILVGTHERLLDLPRNPQAQPSAKRIGDTLGKAGPSMLLSTLAEQGCFLIGGLSPMPAVKSFALLAATALGINFILQVTVLMALLALDERRMLSRRVDIFCCVRSDEPPTAEGGRFVERLFENVLAPTLMKRKVRFVVIFVFLFMLLSCLPLLPHTDVGLDQSLAMTKDSYLFKYFEFMKELLSIGPPVYFVVTKGLNYTLPEHQNLICGGIGCSADSLSTTIQAASKSAELSHIARPASSWLDDIFDWTTLETCCKVFASNGSFCPHDREAPQCTRCQVTVDPTTSRPSGADLRKFVPGFLSDLPDDKCAKGGIAAYSTGVNYVLDASGLADVGDSYFMAYHTPVRTSADYYEAIRAARKVSAKVEKALNSQLELAEPVKVFPYSIFYVYYEQYLGITWETSRSLLISLLVLFTIVTLLNGVDLRASLIVSGIVVAILMEMMAVMVVWGITMNAVSAVNLVVAMGIAVEFNAHVMHAFQKSVKKTRAARAQEALCTTGSSVFSGIFLTKFSGISVLAFAPVQIMQVFYFRMYLSMVLLGAVHGLILLPVLLSYIGE